MTSLSFFFFPYFFCLIFYKLIKKRVPDSHQPFFFSFFIWVIEPLLCLLLDFKAMISGCYMWLTDGKLDIGLVISAWCHLMTCETGVWEGTFFSSNIFPHKSHLFRNISASHNRRKWQQLLWVGGRMSHAKILSHYFFFPKRFENPCISWVVIRKKNQRVGQRTERLSFFISREYVCLCSTAKSNCWAAALLDVKK